DLCRRPKSRLAVATELQEGRLARFGPSLPCPPEGEARDVFPVQPVALLATEVKGPLGKAGIAHGVEDALEVLTVAEVGIENAPGLDGGDGNETGGLGRHGPGLVQTTGAGVGRGEQGRDVDETRRFGTGALQDFNRPGVIPMQ